MEGKSHHITLVIENDRHAASTPKPGDHWRMAHGTGPNRFKNPVIDRKANEKYTVSWKAPKKFGACIIMLDNSPFAENGKPVVRKVIDIPAEQESKPLRIHKGGTYEYAALVKKTDSGGVVDYQYVSGEKSPPGIYVKPPG